MDSVSFRQKLRSGNANIAVKRKGLRSNESSPGAGSANGDFSRSANSADVSSSRVRQAAQGRTEPVV
jgi:hypothetical protein